MINKKVSVIVPVYNSEKYIGKCIDSIYNQSYKNIEILIIDDGSTDNTLKTIKARYSKIKNIRIISKKNEGVAVTRNRGIELSKGHYIMFVDNDDYLEPDCIFNSINKIKNNDIIVSGYQRTNTLGNVIYKRKLRKNNWSIFENMAPWGKLIKKDFLIKNNISFFDFPIGEDIIFNLNMYSKTDKVLINSNVEYNWFYNEASISNTKQQKFNNDITILLNKMCEFDNDYNIKYYISRYCYWYLLFCGRNENSDNFNREYLKVKKWMLENKYNNIINLSHIIKNESSFFNAFSLISIICLDRLKLINVFSKIYCKGDK